MLDESEHLFVKRDYIRELLQCIPLNNGNILKDITFIADSHHFRHEFVVNKVNSQTSMNDSIILNQ